MKKVISLLLIAVLCFGLFGCTPDPDDMAMDFWEALFAGDTETLKSLTLPSVAPILVQGSRNWQDNAVDFDVRLIPLGPTDNRTLDHVEKEYAREKNIYFIITSATSYKCEVVFYYANGDTHTEKPNFEILVAEIDGDLYIIPDL